MMSSLALVFLRPLFCLLLILSCYGLGRGLCLLSRKNEVSAWAKMSLGMALMSLLVYVLGLFHLYTKPFLSGLVLFGVILLFVRPNIRIVKEKIKSAFSFYKVLLLCLCPFILITWARTLSPTYFIDTCQYHFAICSSYLQMGGIGYLADNYLYEVCTSFYPETFYLICIALIDEFTAQTFMWLVGILVLFRFYSLMHLLLPNRNHLLVVLFLAGSTLFSANIIYTKTEPLLIYFILECLILIFSNQYRKLSFLFGIILGFTLFLKFNFAIMAPFVFLWIYLKGKGEIKQFIICLAPGSVFVLLWLAKNLLTHGQILFPYSLSGFAVPDNLLINLRPEYRPFLEQLEVAVRSLFGDGGMDRFNTGIYFWLVLLTFPFSGLWRNKIFLLFVFSGICYWIVHIFKLPMIISISRLTFPLWFLSAYILAKALSRNNHFFKIVLGLVIISQYAITIKNAALYLPGKNYHLGKEDLAKTYSGMGNDFGAMGAQLERLYPEEKIIVYSEYPFLLRHSKAHVVNWSINFDRNNWTVDDFNKYIQGIEVKLILFDKRMSDQSRPFYQWIQNGKEDGFLKVEKESRNALLYRFKLN